MRRLRWPIAISAFLLLMAAAFLIARPPKDDLDSLKPYIVKDETSNNSALATRIATGDPNAPAIVTRDIDLANISRDQTQALLKRCVAHRKGWRIVKAKYLFFKAEGPTRYSGLRAIEFEGDIFVVDEKPLSTWDIWMLRFKNLGKRDPFDHTGEQPRY